MLRSVEPKSLRPTEVFLVPFDLEIRRRTQESDAILQVLVARCRNVVRTRPPRTARDGFGLFLLLSNRWQNACHDYCRREEWPGFAQRNVRPVTPSAVLVSFGGNMDRSPAGSQER